MSRCRRLGTARGKWARLSVSAALGTRQLQQRRRNESASDRGSLRPTQHATWHQFRLPLLMDEQAYDVAGYIVSQNRPEKANLDKDFPIRLQKPIDTPYGPYADGFSEAQHRLGPFGPIRAKVKELAAVSRTANAGGPDNGSYESEGAK